VFFYESFGELKNFINASFLSIFIEQINKVSAIFEIFYDFNFNVDFFIYKNYCDETASTQFKKNFTKNHFFKDL